MKICTHNLTELELPGGTTFWMCLGGTVPWAGIRDGIKRRKSADALGSSTDTMPQVPGPSICEPKGTPPLYCFCQVCCGSRRPAPHVFPSSHPTPIASPPPPTASPTPLFILPLQSGPGVSPKGSLLRRGPPLGTQMLKTCNCGSYSYRSLPVFDACTY